MCELYFNSQKITLHFKDGIISSIVLVLLELGSFCVQLGIFAVCVFLI